MNDSHERRRVQRVRLLTPLRGTAGAVRVVVIDLSTRGICVAHRERLGRVGETCVVRAEWEGRPIELTCVIAHTRVQKSATSTEPALHHSGLEIREAAGSSAMTLRSIVETHVARALDEQKANARGVPPIASISVQGKKARHYVRHELILGRWREVATTDPSQPENGFTLSADHTAREVEMLRLAYERGAASGDRSLIRRLAQLSIGSAEQVPVRRYAP